MTLLLDTNAFIWFCQNHPMLSFTAKQLIEDPSNRKVVSVATCWEIAIKVGLGKLKLAESSKSYLQNALAKTQFELLPISLVHATAVEFLPQHHRDPFDRLLIAQARIEEIAIVSSDALFDRYEIIRYW